MPLAMPQTKNYDPIWDELQKLPEADYEYPPEVVERWDRELDIARLQMATGELQSWDDFIAERRFEN